jgi:hypothetical protein
VGGILENCDFSVDQLHRCSCTSHYLLR